MTSLLRKYAQNDTRLENVTLTGFISDNGFKTGALTIQRPAYAPIDLTKSKNFSIDTRVLTLRTDSTDGFLLKIYISSSKPPSYNQNFDFDIFLTPPINEQRIFIDIYADKVNAENSITLSPSVRLYQIINEYPTSPGDYSDQTGIISFKVLNNSIILKSIPPFWTI
jgi:hypothetical protein